MSFAASASSSCTVIVVGVFELARQIHSLSPEDRAVVLDLLRHLRSASQSADADTPAHSDVPRRLVRMPG